MTRGAMRIVAATWESDACMVASKKRKGRCGSAPNFNKASTARRSSEKQGANSGFMTARSTVLMSAPLSTCVEINQ